MEERSSRIVKEHWASTLSCDPSTICSAGTTVTAWDDRAVEFLLRDDGAVVAAPDSLTEAVRNRSDRISFALARDEARAIVEPLAAVDDVLGPQFVGYCDRSTFSPVETDAERIDPESLGSLRAACPSDEWARSGVAADGTDAPTFAVLEDRRPIAVAQLQVAHDVAGVATITHPDHRSQGNATAAVSGAVEWALDVGLLAEYRTIETWSSSVALAERLGFVRTARSILVELD